MTAIKDKIKNLTNSQLKGDILELEQIMEALRDKDHGCPWDKEQDHLSIRSYLIEEAYEAVEALELKNDQNIKSELGDVLLQVIFHSQLAKERQAFSLKDVILNISEKMIRRHPHVFSNEEVKDSKEVLENWEKIKAQEKSNITQNKETFSKTLKKMPKTLPSLLTSERIGEKSARVQFDWQDLKGVIEKVEEEFLEIKDAFNKVFSNPEKIKRPLTQDELNSNREKLEDIGSEIGDCIFSLTQLARWLGFSSEDLTRECCNRFIDRLRIIEEEFKTDLTALSPEDKHAAWVKAKEFLKKQS